MLITRALVGRFLAPAFTVWILAGGIPCAFAVETKVIRDETFSQFNQGESTGTELQAVGRIKIAPRAQKLEKTEDGVAWSVAVDPVDNSVFYSTGHSGKVYRHTSGAKPELWADLTELEAISLVVDPTGALLIGASPGGKIYRVVQPGKPQLFFETKEQYVWDMAFDSKGLLYAATGPNGKIFKIRGEHNGEVYYDSDATNVMSLAFDAQGNLIAGTQGKAFLLRINAAGKAYVMYASSEDEIRAIASDAAGNLYAAVNSARTSSVFEKSADKDDKPVSVLNMGSATPTPSPTPKTDGEGSSPFGSSSSFGSGLGGQSFLVQVQPSGFVTNFWPSPEGPIHSMLSDLETSSILVAAGKHGKIFRVNTADANHSVIADVEEPMVLSLARLNGRTYFTTANKAALYELVTSSTVLEGTFASRAFNAGSTVLWGNLYCEAEITSGGEVSFETRSGNTSEPSDGTWSEWSAATQVNPKIVKITSPVAQYLQYRLTMRTPQATVGPVVDSIQAFYVQQNAAPIIRNIDITKLGGGTPPGSGSSPGSSSFSAMASMLGARLAVPAPTPGTPGEPGGPGAAAARAPSMSGTSSPFGPAPSSLASRGEDTDLRPMGSGFAVSQNSQRVAITWDASDPNQDKLSYNLYFRGEDEAEWKLIEEDLSSPRFMFSTEAIPDGKYRIKVEATDAPENEETSASTVSLISRIYVVDNTPPEIKNLSGSKVGTNSYVITAEASDSTSIIAAAEYNMDADPQWQAVSPVDGIFDLQRETFKFHAKAEKVNADLKEHTLSLRVYDREGNSHVEKVLLK